ncbi:HNH endonuclease signature motif containing protein [Spiroplasma cantharicola]|uniref:HNH nuclease domain-containing protein n=1 Tax=Spiroplasma cantharicola TaxID=362837 RepID=A0A0M4JSL6_9MOLU|nr:HNH endonuclease signature motif containing protein [Spiroplasma cantharicola]ALD66572.1 hypothetical protein SCANT_v1c06660 [Spiroplasma cantharicola]
MSNIKIVFKRDSILANDKLLKELIKTMKLENCVKEIVDNNFFSIENENFKLTKFTAIIIRYENDKILECDFILTSREYEADSRNIFISQGFISFMQMFVDKKMDNKNFVLFVFKQYKNISLSCSLHIEMIRNIFKSLSFNKEVLNVYAQDDIFNCELKNIENLSYYRNELSKKNSSNKSNLLELLDANEISLLLNFGAANNGEAWLIIIYCSIYFKGQINIYSIKEFKMDKNFLNFIKKINKKIFFKGWINSKKVPTEELNAIFKEVHYKTDITFENKKTPTLPEIQEAIRRYSLIYHNNLISKYGSKECILCDCNNPSLIVGAHIKRFSDIKNQENISLEQKYKEIVDGDNGFWFCSNHDKLFEHGYIIFHENRFHITEKCSEEEFKYIVKITTKKLKINKELINENFINYTLEHKKRFGF